MPIKNKRDWILPYVQNKKVLDLGCVQHNLTKTREPNWLHGAIRACAKSVVGVDILQNEIRALAQQGFCVINADVENMDLHDQFDVVVAGDIIEHLSNPGLFMNAVSKHLAKDGIFLVTTPNPVTSLRVLELLFKNRLAVNPEHTCWFTIQVLSELARRSQMKVVDVTYVDDAYLYYRPRSWPWRPFLLAHSLLCRLQPQLSETLCCALQNE